MTRLYYEINEKPEREDEIKNQIEAAMDEGKPYASELAVVKVQQEKEKEKSSDESDKDSDASSSSSSSSSSSASEKNNQSASSPEVQLEMKKATEAGEIYSLYQRGLDNKRFQEEYPDFPLSLSYYRCVITNDCMDALQHFPHLFLLPGLFHANKSLKSFQ